MITSKAGPSIHDNITLILVALQRKDLKCDQTKEYLITSNEFLGYGVNRCGDLSHLGALPDNYSKCKATRR